MDVEMNMLFYSNISGLNVGQKSMMLLPFRYKSKPLGKKEWFEIVGSDNKAITSFQQLRSERF